MNDTDTPGWRAKVSLYGLWPARRFAWGEFGATAMKKEYQAIDIRRWVQ